MPEERESVAAASDRELAQTLDLLSERVARYRVDDLVLVYCNRAWAAEHLAEPDELIGLPMTDLLGPSELEGLHSQLARLGPSTPFLHDPTPRSAPRMVGRWVEWADRYLPGPTGAHILAVGRDVTERRVAEERLAQSEARFRDLADRSADIVWRVSVHPHPHLSYLSPSVERLTGWTPAAFGDRMDHLLEILDPQAREMALQALAGRPLADRFDARVRRADGSWAVLEMQVVRLPDGLQGVARDVTEMRQLQEDLAELALRDPLTGLANRRLLDILLAAALTRAARTSEPLVVTYVDLDDFKGVNDGYGHAAGDAVLIEVARRLEGTVRGADIVARLGGDEFIVVHEAVGDGLAAVGERIRTALAPPYTLPSGDVVTCTASLGESDTRGHLDAPSLFAAADAAMYAAKRARTGRERHTDG
ncbi:MAG: diguanylate cyclase [Cellulomonadaceae bacterium]|nr:diguanylate cyclase [Cellulomonadaceae bacterium]